ncbi:MAG: GTP 3',8-cyclase MoaA [Deltaproteobacteria bacterium]|nr:GTP 3',8-cyclase MoaA [Deltaproteobacteria bacterium]
MFKPTLQDGHNRRVSYVRISVTDRCNLRCRYCSSPAFNSHFREEILSYEEIERLVRVLVTLGIDKVRLTGGEPLTRRHLDTLIRRLILIEGINDISLTTNGVALADQVESLRAAGLKRINISLDTLKPERFAEITGRDCFDQVRAGIEAAFKAGFSPVKLNVVVMRGVNDDELVEFARLTLKLPLHVRFIEYMPIGSSSSWSGGQVVTGAEILQRIAEGLGRLETVTTTPGSPARLYRLAAARGRIGVIAAMSEHFCASCNRIRVTADGRLRPCLLSDDEFDIKSLLRRGAGPEEIADLVRRAVAGKSAAHGLTCNAERKCARQMATIGG